MEFKPDKEALIKLIQYKMPFGKYKDWYLVDIPEYYYTWFRQKGFPKGKLGEMMRSVHDMKSNGLDSLLADLKQKINS
ncbi:DUF3820 family protein [Spongiivirga sp. MCCC 1A20706]|uniref:DUF3820 family protein n=1 Tax=Spongiivirga sp. MCCC 1A20706 TaxID=3160963 RepID=UPI0039778DC2